MLSHTIKLLLGILLFFTTYLNVIIICTTLLGTLKYLIEPYVHVRVKESNYKAKVFPEKYLIL